jgi:hypothetical protein
LEVSTILWERVMAAEGLLNADELKLFGSAADNLISIRSLVGCRQKKRSRKRDAGNDREDSRAFW